VDISKDAQQAVIDYVPEDQPVKLPGYRPRMAPLPDEFEHAIDLINNAQRPVILAGAGVIKSGAMQQLVDFISKTEMPTAMTLLGLGGLPASHPLNLGMMGMHGEAWVNKSIQEADLLLAFGMRFDDRVTGNLKNYARHAKKIHIDIDPAEIDKNVKVDVGLVGDLKDIVSALILRVAPQKRPKWVDYITSQQGDSAVRDIQTLPDTGALYAAHVIHDIWRGTDDDAIIVTDVGQHQMWEAQYYRHELPRTLITSGGLGTMGFALPAAIGAKFAHPDRDVWVIAGDGGFQMTACELSTIAQEGLHINIAIINNGYLGMVRQWQEFFYDRRYAATPIRSPDFVKLAEAHGLAGGRVETRPDVAKAVADARAGGVAKLIDFRVEEEETVYPMVAAGKDLDDMIRRPAAKNPLHETGEDR